MSNKGHLFSRPVGAVPNNTSPTHMISKSPPDSEKSNEKKTNIQLDAVSIWGYSSDTAPQRMINRYYSRLAAIHFVLFNFLEHLHQMYFTQEDILVRKMYQSHCFDTAKRATNHDLFLSLNRKGNG